MPEFIIVLLSLTFGIIIGWILKGRSQPAGSQDLQQEINKLHKTFFKKRIGVRLTLPVPSPTKQCNIVTFYKIVGMGIVEFNILS